MESILKQVLLTGSLKILHFKKESFLSVALAIEKITGLQNGFNFLYGFEQDVIYGLPPDVHKLGNLAIFEMQVIF